MKIILVRHGKTLANEKGVFESAAMGELSETGKEQVRKLALRLKDEKIDCIYSSPIMRAALTAKEIARFHLKTPFVFSEDLREGETKGFEGKPYSAITDWNNPPKGVESNEDVNKRAKKLIDKIYKKHKNDCVLLVGHNAINRSLIHVITGQPRWGINQHNTGVNIFEINEDKTHKIHCLNCTRHLEGE
jgi:broad specificity phosphatase PhoE